MRDIASLVIACTIVASCTRSSDTEEAEFQSKQDSVSRITDSASLAAMKVEEENVDTTSFTITDSTIQIKRDIYPTVTGRIVSLLVTGIDARLGEGSGRADANHIIRFILDSGYIEIISIPRGTYANAGFDDTTNLNMIANVRTARGKQAYLREVARIAGIPKVDYWVEFGFSQAIGLLELMGYKENANSTLRVLRSRKAYASGDFQRSYNQGQFIRQAVLRTFDKTDDVMGQLAMRAALMLVETNLTYDITQYLLNEVRGKGFSSASQDRIWVRMRPATVSRFQVFSFDSSNVGRLNEQISKRVDPMIPDSAAERSADYERRLVRIVERAGADSASAPKRVISALSRPFLQRAWLQIQDKQKRLVTRDRICGLLMSAYTRTGDTAAVSSIQQYLEIDNKATAGR